MNKKKSKIKDKKDYTVIFSFVIILLAIIQYANTLGHDYAWDDAIVIRDNSYTQDGLSSLKDIWTQPVYIPQREIYRPIPQTTFALENHFFPDGNPKVGHLINILLYAFCCFLLFHFFKRLIPQYHLIFAFLASLLFVVHPIHTEVVANIKSRDEILAMCFGLGSMIYFMKYLSTNKLFNIISVIILLIFACLSKLNAITLLAFYPIIYYSRFTSLTKKLSQYSLFSKNKENTDSTESSILENLKVIPKLGIALFCLSIVALSVYLYNDELIALILVLFISSILILHFNKIEIWDFTFLISVLLVLAYFFNLSYTYEVSLIIFLIYIYINKLWKIKYFIPIVLLLIPRLLENPVSLATLLAFFIIVSKYQGKKLTNLLGLYSIASISTIVLGNYILACVFSIPVIFFFLQKSKSLHRFVPIISIGFLLIIFSFEVTYNSPLTNLELIVNDDINNKSEKLKLSIINNSLINLPNGLRLPTKSKIQLDYLKKSFFPHPLIHNYGFNVIKSVSWKSPTPWISLFIYLLLFLFVLKRIRQKDPIALGILFYVITLSIYTNIVLLAPDTMAERFLYFPSIGFCLAFIFLWTGITKANLELKPFANSNNLLFYTGLILILFLYFYKTFDRNKDWKDNKTLATNTLPHAPNSALIHANYAGEWMHVFEVVSQSTDQKALQDAIKASERSLEIHPNYFNSMLDLGMMYLSAGEVDKAESIYNKAITINTSHPSPYLSLGLIYYSKQEYNKGIANLEQVRKKVLENQDKTIVDADGLQQLYLFLARCYYNVGQLDQAKMLLEEATSISPTNASYFELLANMYANNNDLDTAILYLEKAGQISPNNPSILEKLNNWKAN